MVKRTPSATANKPMPSIVRNSGDLPISGCRDLGVRKIAAALIGLVTNKLNDTSESRGISRRSAQNDAPDRIHPIGYDNGVFIGESRAFFAMLRSWKWSSFAFATN